MYRSGFKSLIFISLCICFCLGNNCHSAKKKPIGVTVYALEYPPFSYEENGIAAGIYTEILQQVFARMKDYNVTIKAVPWKRGINYLKRGKAFAAYPPSYRPKQRPFISPYSIPIYNEKAVVFCTEDIIKDKKRPDWPEDYYGLIVGNNAGYAYGGAKFWQAVKAGKITVEEANHTESNILKLAKRRIDCYMNERMAFLLSLKRLKQAGKYNPSKGDAKIIEGPTISEEKAYLAYTNQDKDKFFFKNDFVKQFNLILSEMIKNGQVQRIMEGYLSEETKHPASASGDK